MEIKKIKPLENIGYWEKISGIYICGKCKYYTDKAESECPRCGCTMISVIEKVKKD